MSLMIVRGVLIVALFLQGLSSNAFAINCQEVRQLAAVYLKLHFAYKKFDDEISKRTLDLFIRSWDPGKLYFYQADIDELKKKYETSIDDTVMAANCMIVDDTIKLYGKRFEERHKEVAKLIDLDHKFNIDESMELDRKKIEYAKTSEELTERWRQRVKFQLLQLNRNLADLKKSREKVRKRYTLDIKRHNEETLDRVYARFLNAFAMSLDPHSDYMSPDQHEDSRIQMRLSLEGIGAVLRSEDGFTVIQSIVAGGAAAKNGKLKVGDKIIAVAQETGVPVDVVDMDLPDVVKLIRGPGGSKVKLTVTREESGKSRQMDIEIVREKVQLTNSAAQTKFVDVKVSKNKGDKPLKIAILNLPSFYLDFEGQNKQQSNYRSSAIDMMEQLVLINKKKADGLVVDLRANGGGSLTESIKIAGLFFDKGPVVQIKETDGTVFAQNDTDDGALFTGPLVVLISRQSASASEIFAGAIQDLERGLIVGDDHTYGKGTVQNLKEISSKLGAMKVTISKFYRPSGSSNQLRGVESDVVIPSLLSELEIGEKHYDYALEWDKINSSKYPRFGKVQPYLADLRRRSSERVKTEPTYIELAKEIEEWQKSKDKRTQVSLNEKEEKKSKAAEKEEEVEDAAMDDASFPRLEDDINMQEAVRIAADYTRLLQKKSLELAEIQGLKPKKNAANKKTANK